MVRETRYLWIGNLPEGITEQRLTELFARHGRVQSVKLHRLDGGGDRLNAVLAFMDIKSAAKAHNSENVIDGLLVQTQYNEPTVVSTSGLPAGHCHEAPPLPLLSGSRPAGTTLSAPEQIVWNTTSSSSSSTTSSVSSSSSSSSSSSAANPGLNSCLGNGPQVSRDDRHYHHQHNNQHHHHHHHNHQHHQANSGMYTSSRCHQKVASELSNGNCVGNGEKGCLRPTFALSDSCPSSSGKMLTDLLGDRRFQCGRCSPKQHLAGALCTENGLKKSSHLGGGSGGGGGGPVIQENKAICVQGFPANLSDACIKDGLHHQYRKVGRVLSVVVMGQKDKRCGIVTFLKREDVLHCLEGGTAERQFLNHPVTISEHEGFGDHESKRVDVPHDEFHHKATRTLYVGNLELSVTKEQLQQIFRKYGFLIDVELKNQSQSTAAHAYLQYDSISSVVHAVKDMHSKYIGNNLIKLGYGKTQPTNCLLVDRIVETVSEKILRRLFTRYGQVLHSVIDKESRRCLVYYDSSKHAQRALTELQGKALAGKRIQIDFASKECQSVFYKKLERTGNSAAKHSSTMALHRPIASLSHADHGRVLRDIGLEMGPSQATDSSERLLGGATPHGRGQRPSDNQNREAVTEAQTLTPDYGVERQRSSCRTPADGGASSVHIPADGDYGRVRLKDPELRISDTNCGARPNPSRKNCVASCEMPLNDRDRQLEKALVSQGKTSAIQPSNSSVTQLPSNENNGPHDRLGCPKAPPESSTPDLKAAICVPSDTHRKPALSEQLVRQSSHGRLDGLDCHGPAEERVGGAGKTYAPSGGARGHSPADRHEGERRTHGDCDGLTSSKRDSKEVLVVSDKLEDAPVEFPRSRFSKSGPCKNPGESVTRIVGSQYSIVSSTSADSKSDESAKSVAKAHHMTTWSTPDSRRPVSVEGKYSKSRIPESRSSLSGTAVNSSPRNSRKFPGVEHGRPAPLEDPSGPGTNGSPLPAKHLPGERSGETYGDAPSHLSSSSISANATAPDESTERNRHRSDIVDIDNLHQMKRYYMTKHRKLDEFRGTNNRCSAEPNSEKTEPPAATPARPPDPKQSRCLGDLTVPWCERSESGETLARQEDPRMLSSARTCRVMSAPFANDLNPTSGPGAEVSSRGRALSLPLPKFAHWTRTSSNDLDTRKRRLSVETSHLRSFSKPVCSSAGISSPHHSPNPVKSDNVSFGFFPDSRTVDGITPSKTDGTTELEVGAQSVAEPDKICGKAEDSFTAETKIDDEDISSDVARDVGVDPETEPLDKPPVPETLETDSTGSRYLTVHNQNDQNGATDLNNSVASLVPELEKPGLSSENDKPKREGNCSDSIGRELEAGETETICEDDILSNEKQLLDDCVKSSCNNFEPPSEVDVNSESPIRRSIHLIATAAAANSSSSGEEVTLSKTEIETELEADVDKSVADLDSAEKYLNEPSLNVAVVSQDVSLSLVQGSGVSAVMSFDSLSTNDKTLNTDAENNICGFSRPDEGHGIEEFALVTKQDFDEKLVETEVKLGEGSRSTDDKNGIHLKNKESVGSVNESVEESPRSDTIEKPKSEICTTVLPNDESSEKPKIASMTNEKTTKNTHEISGQKRKAGIPLESHSQTRLKNSAVDDATNDPLSKRKMERGRKEEEEVPSLAKRPKFEDADVAKRQDASKAKEHGKSSKPDKSNHSSSKISSQSLKPSTHGHSTVKKDGNDRHTAHIPNSKPADCGSDTRKKSSSSSDGTSGKRAGGPPHDSAETAGKSDFDLSHAHRKSSHKEDSKTSCSESTKSSNCVDKTCESRLTARHNEVRSDRSETTHHKLEKNCRNKSEKCGADQSREKKVAHEVEQPNAKGLGDVRTAEGKCVKSSGKDRENTKTSDDKSQKAREKSKDEKTSRVEPARHVSSDRKNSVVHHSTSSSVKSSSSEKKSEHRSRSSATDMVKSSGSTRKHDSNSNSSLVSKATDHSQDHRKHSQNAKHPSSDSCKPQDRPTKGTIAATDKTTREHRIGSNCVSDHAKQHSADIFSAGKVSNESSRNVERNSKNCTDPVKKDHKHSKGISTENAGNNPSRTADGKPSESLKQSDRGVRPAAESDRHHSRKKVPEPAVPDARNSSRSRRESGNSGGTKRDDNSTSKDKPSKTEHKEKSQNSREKCSSLGHGAKPTTPNNSKKSESVVRREKERGFAKNTDKTVRASAARRDKSSRRPEEKRELKALLQEQDEELLLAPYMSMYDMVKRRSNKEREKEEAAKMEQLRSKTLDKLQASRSRQRKKSTVSLDENSATGSETPKDTKYKSMSSKRKSSYDEHHARQRSWAIDSSSLSSSASSLDKNDDDDEEEEEEEKINDEEEDDDGEDDDDELMKPSLKTPSRSRKPSKSENSGSGSSDERCVAGQRSSSRGTKKMAPRPRPQKNWKGLSVYVTSDSEEDDKREIDVRTSGRESRAAVGKGPHFQSIRRSSVNRENSKSTNRKEKLRKFALFSSSSSSSTTSAESSDCEPQTNAKTCGQHSNLNNKTPVNRKDPFSVTSGSKEGAISAATGASNVPSEVAVKPSKDVRRDAEKHPKKSDDRTKSTPSGFDGGTERRVLSSNFAAERTREPENRVKNTEEELSRQNKKLDVQKETSPMSIDSPKPKVTRNLCRIDGLWVEEHIIKKKPKPHRLPLDDKSKAKRERNVSTKTKTFGKMDGSGVKSANSFIAKPTMDRTVEKSVEKSQPEAFPEARHGGERVGCQMEPAREEGSRTTSYARLDNIFEKMEQNDGRKERDSSMDESPEAFFCERKEESKAQLEEEYDGTKGKEESREETEEMRINLVPENLESVELTQETCKKMCINSNSCGSLLNSTVVAADKVILESATEAEAVGKHADEESWPKKNCRENEGNSLVEVKEENEESFRKGLVLNSVGELAATPLADAKHYMKAEKLEVDENISKELFNLDDDDNDDDDDLCKSIAFKGEISDMKLGFDFNSTCEEQMTLADVTSSLILNPEDVPVEPTAATEKNPDETASKMPLNVNYAEEKEHLGIDEDSLEEFLVDDVMFTTVDPRTEEREYFVNRISTSESPVQFSCPMPSFRDFFVWVKPVSAEIKPMGNGQSAEMQPAEDKPYVQPEMVASAEVTEVPAEIKASSPGDVSIESDVKDTVTMSDDIASKESPIAIEGTQSREDEKEEEEADTLVEPAGVVSGADESQLNPTLEVSKSRGRKLIAKNDADKKPGAGEKPGRGVLAAAGMHSTPKGAILRTRLQGNVEIVESFSSRGRKIIPKDRDRDFMQVGSKSNTKVGLNVVGGGCGRGRGRKGKFASNIVDVRPGRKSTDSLEGTDESQEIDENDEKLSARPLVTAQRRLLNVRNSCHGRRAESLCASNFGKSNAKDVATLTIARKYGRSPSIRNRCQKSETSSAKSLVIHLNKITVPSDCGKRAAAGKGKKEEKMNVNGVKDLYEFEDEDEIGPIPEYKHKRPLKRQKDSPTADAAAKLDSRTEEDESIATSEPAPKRRKRTVKGRSRCQPGRAAASKAQRGKITTRSQACAPPVVVENESSESRSTETKPEAGGLKPAKSSAFDEPLSQPPRHLPLKLEMKEQRQAAAVSVASNVGSRRGHVGAFSAGDDTGSASTGSLTDASSKPSAVAEVSQFNFEKAIDEAVCGNADRRNSSEFSGPSQVPSSQLDLRARENQLEMAEQATVTSSCYIPDNSSDAMDAAVIQHQQTLHRKPSEKDLNVEFQTASFEHRPVFPIALSNETSDVCHQLSPLSVKSQENSLQNRPPSSHEDVKQIKDQIRGPESFESDPGDRQQISHSSPGSFRSVSSDDIRLVLAQSAQLNQHQQQQQQPKLFQPQQAQVTSAASVSASQSNVVSFLPVELIPGHHDQRWKLHAAVDPLARPDAKTAPSTQLPRQAHPPTAAVAPHFADSCLAPGVSGIRPDARGSHAAQSPVAGVYPQPIYSNLHLLSYLPVGVDFQSYERMLMAINQQQQQQQHLMSQGLIFPPGIISVAPHKGMADKGQDRAAVHGPSSMSVASSPKTDPVAISRLIPEHSDVLFLLLKKYPVIWQGLLSLKNDFSAVQMHFIAGNEQLVKLSLPENSQLRLSQRMRLEPSQLEQVSKRMMNPNEYCMLVALPCGQDHLDIIMQSNNLRAGFINYLQQKQAAGIVNIVDPVSSQTAYVVHIFPPCHFTSEHLVDQASDLLHSINDMAYLLVVIATV